MLKTGLKVDLDKRCSLLILQPCSFVLFIHPFFGEKTLKAMRHFRVKWKFLEIRFKREWYEAKMVGSYGMCKCISRIEYAGISFGLDWVQTDKNKNNKRAINNFQISLHFRLERQNDLTKYFWINIC